MTLQSLRQQAKRLGGDAGAAARAAVKGETGDARVYRALSKTGSPRELPVSPQ